MAVKLSTDRIALILGGVALVLMLFLIFQQFSSLGAAKEQVALEKQSFELMEKRLQQLEQAKASEEETRQKMERAIKAIPTSPDENVLINDLKYKADDSGTHFLEIKFENRVSKEGYLEMPFKVTFEGYYQGLVELMDSVKDGPRAVRINEMILKKGSQEGLVRVELTASAFYRNSN